MEEHLDEKKHPLWHFGVLMLLVYHTITTPYRLAFGTPLTPLSLDLFVDALLILDAFLFWKNTRSRGFWIDTMAGMPFHMIWAPLALIRLLRWSTLTHRFPSTGPSVFRDPVHLRMLKVLVAIGLIAHLVACMWYWVAHTHLSGEHTWLEEQGIELATVPIQYLYSLYWAITTMTTVGYGDITPNNPIEVSFTIVGMLLGVTCWAYTVATISSLISQRNSRAALYTDNIHAISQYLDYHQVKPDLKTKVRDYYDRLWLRNRAIPDADVLNQLSPSLRHELNLHIHQETIRQVPFFKQLSEGFRTSIANYLVPTLMAPNDVIMHVGEIGDEMYFLERGEVEIFNEEGEHVGTIGPGSFFGELALLFGKPRTATVKAKTYCDVAILRQEDFQHVLKQYPQFGQMVMDVSQQRMDTLDPATL